MLSEKLILVLSGVTWTAPKLIAEVIPALDIPGLQWFAQGSSLAMLAWYMWYTQTKSLPNIVAEGNKRCSEQLEAFNKQLDRHLDAFNSQMDNQRTQERTQLDKILEDAAKDRDEHAKDRESWRDVRHAVGGAIAEAKIAEELLSAYKTAHGIKSNEEILSDKEETTVVEATKSTISKKRGH